MKGIADYVFIELLGQGNHGSFWRARPPERLAIDGPEFVAVKALAARATDDDFKRMANELRVYATVDSNFIAPVLDAGQQDGRLFYAVPYFPDGSLASPARPLSQAETIGLMSDASRGADALHNAGIAHRDIKPANIMISGSPGEPRPRGLLSDLGLAQIINPGQTVTGIGPVGTLEYLAPELVRGEKSSRASDVWALGVSIHRALSGRSVYSALPEESLLDALRYVMTSTPALDEALPATVVPIVERCLAEDPSRRFPTASALADALDESTFK